jgi:hypothetical protein
LRCSNYLNMKKSPKKFLEIKDDDTIVSIEIEKSIVDFYKKETGRQHVTTKGLSQYFNRLIKYFKRY